jgi:thiamine kinase-like enzyme
VLTHRAVLSYLLDRQLVDCESLVDGDLRIVSDAQRHVSFSVVVQDGQSYLVKHATGADEQRTIAREARLNRQMGDASSGNVRPYLPQIRAIGGAGHTLIFDYIRDARTLREDHALRGQFPGRSAAVLGEALGCLHTTQFPVQADGQDSTRLPWVLSFHTPNPTMHRNASAASVQLMKTVQEFPEIGRLLDGLCEEWQPSARIHNDLKWDNIIIFTPPGTRRAELRIVDWEMTGFGDPCWDVGTCFSEYLSFWLFSMPITGRLTTGMAMELARYPLTAMQPAMRAFWQAYTRRMGLDAATAGAWLCRATRYSAARLIQTAFERLQMAESMPGSTYVLLQLSLNMLLRPRDAASQLLGIAPPHPSVA